MLYSSRAAAEESSGARSCDPRAVSTTKQRGVLLERGLSELLATAREEEAKEKPNGKPRREGCVLSYGTLYGTLSRQMQEERPAKRKIDVFGPDLAFHLISLSTTTFPELSTHQEEEEGASKKKSRCWSTDQHQDQHPTQPKRELVIAGIIGGGR